jgi:hypothetical protein
MGLAGRPAQNPYLSRRPKVIDTINDPRLADLPHGQIMAILAEEQQYVGSEMTIYRIMRE